MKRSIITLGLGLFVSGAAYAGVDLIKVPALCGTSAEVLGTLSTKMPNPLEIGQGGDGHGAPIATLLSGNGYWALLATISPERVCVVASGYNWILTDPQAAF